jgi:hypothetical protein
MGWLSKRAHQGNPVGGVASKETLSAPLRKVLYRTLFTDSLFGKDWAALECGHEGSVTPGAQRARCQTCRKEATKES